MLCECGKCGLEAKSGNRFIHGHANRGKTISENQREKIRAANTGKHPSSETRKRRCISGMQFNHPDWTLEQIEFYIEHKNDLHLCACNCGQLCKRRFVYGHSLVVLGKERRGKPGWNKGLTKETDTRLGTKPITVEQQSMFPYICECGCKQRCRKRFVQGHAVTGKHIHLGKKTWNSGLTAVNDSRILSGESHGMYGLHHSDETIAKGMAHSGWHRFPYIFPDGVIKKMRSSWEVLYAQFLDSLNIEWIYEPEGFKLSNGKRYWPDFYLPALNEWHEVKGWMSGQSQEKIDLFQKDYPGEKLVVLRDIPNYIRTNAILGEK